MGRPAGFFDVEERLAGLSKKGDDLERLAGVVDFELFRPELERAVPRADRAKGGRPPFDHVLMFKVLILQTQNNLSDERTEFYLRDRLTWMRFLGLGLGDPVPDANTHLDLPRGADQGRRDRAPVQPVRPGAPGRRATSRCPGNWSTRASSPRPSSATPRPRSRRSRKAGCRRTGRTKPAKLSQKDRDARWTVKTTKAKPREGESADGRPGDPRVRLPEPHQRRSPPPADPPLAGHRRRRACRRAPGRSARPRQHRRGRLGRHRLPFEEERGPAAPADAGEPHPDLGLFRGLDPARAEAVSARAVAIGALTYKSLASILAHNLDRARPQLEGVAGHRPSQRPRPPLLPLTEIPHARPSDFDLHTLGLHVMAKGYQEIDANPEAPPSDAAPPYAAPQASSVFARRSFSAAISSIDSASSFFSRRFSSSRLFRRCASDGPSPPYRASSDRRSAR